MFKLNPASGPLQIWHMPQKDRMYSMGVDPAEGSGNAEADNAVIQIVDAVSGVQCAEWASNSHPPHDIGEAANMIGRFYGGARGEAFAVIEENNHGRQVIDQMKTLGYRNFYIRRTQADFGQRFTNKIGWFTTRAMKDVLVDKGRAVYELYPNLVCSRALRAEMASFYFIPPKNNPTGHAQPMALSGARDDRVMAWLMALMGVRFAEGQLSAAATKEPEKSADQRLVEAHLVRVAGEVNPKKRPKRVRQTLFQPWYYG